MTTTQETAILISTTLRIEFVAFIINKHQYNRHTSPHLETTMRTSEQTNKVKRWFQRGLPADCYADGVGWGLDTKRTNYRLFNWDHVLSHVKILSGHYIATHILSRFCRLAYLKLEKTGETMLDQVERKSQCKSALRCMMNYTWLAPPFLCVYQTNSRNFTW